MNINQTTASTAMILLNAPNMLPIRVGALVDSGLVTTSPNIVTSAWRDRSSGLVAADTIS
ncbi:hypothetical protein SEN081537_35490 [Salmonella enterica subsp. enterica serovar Typhimurium]|nr:hypothetical protein SEN081537_35490 [Salmonella enterica subsp. enterica serovar Typhimurium]BDP12311.1 hypothetical protein TUM13735_47100 [Escherichia coli]GCE74270.1 hypothetical protein SEA27A368_41030 [Salmonella enterica]GJL48481.1 hypothetical protein TUM17580_45400 [Citrobacter farmeri]BEA79981.1 hypothetical protein VEE07_45350 [Escherichia coli]